MGDFGETVPKTIRIPVELFGECERVQRELDTDFSKLCRVALRYYLNSLSDRLSDGEEVRHGD